MKKGLFLLLMVFTTLIGKVWAESYPLWVAGIQVTSANAGDITGANISGTVSYNPATKMLSLSNATIMAEGTWDGIRSDIDDFSIVLYGNNTITSAQGNGLNFSYSAAIGGSGILDVTGTSGILTFGDLTIRGGCRITANGFEPEKGTGIKGQTTKKLTIEDSYVFAYSEATLRSAINGFKDLILKGVELYLPKESVYCFYNIYTIGTGQHPGEGQVGEAVIVPSLFDLWVYGHRVIAMFCETIGGTGIDGDVSYDPVSNTLTLRNAEIGGNFQHGIESDIEGLTINLIGENIISTHKDGMRLRGETTIKGSGSLNIWGENGIYSVGSNLSIVGGCTVNARGTGTYANSAILGSYPHILTIEANIIANAASSSSSAISGFNTMNLLHSEFGMPANASYQNQLVYSQNSPYFGQVTINLNVPNNFNLWIAGRRVSLSNYNDILRDGSVRYDIENNILRLNNAKIKGNEHAGINNEIPELTIDVVGTNTITSDDEGIYSENQNITITGKGTLKVTGEDGIFMNEGNLTLINLGKLTATGKGTTNCAGIYGSTGHTFTIYNTPVTAKSTSSSRSPISRFQDIVFNGAEISTPSHGSYHDRDVYDSQGNMVTDKVIIKLAGYDLWVGGQQVTAANYNDVLDDGSVNYNPFTNILTLHDASINTSNNTEPSILNQIPDLVINLIGDNVLRASSAPGFSSTQDVTFKGTGSLTSSGYNGINVMGDLTIQDGCSVNATGLNGNGMVGTGILSITESNLYATPKTNYSAIRGFQTLNLFLEKYIIPSSTINYDVNGFTYMGGQAYYGPVSIVASHYNLEVNGIRVTAENANDILGNGRVSFNSDSNTLTLSNAYIDAESNKGINSSVNNLIIHLEGNNIILSNSDGIYSNANFQIEGPGSLSVTGGTNGIYANNCNLTFCNECAVNATGTETGIKGGIYLTINNGDVTASSGTGNHSPIQNFTGLTCIGVGFFTPADGVYNRSQRCVFSNGQVYYGRVQIKPLPFNIWVDGTAVTTANADDILGNHTVRYSPTQNRLTLNNANITSSTYPGIKSKSSDLEIYVIGDNTITSSGHKGIFSDGQNLKITGPSSASLSVSGNDGIHVYQGNLEINNVNVNVIGIASGYYSALSGSAGHSLIFRGKQCNVTAVSASRTHSAICGFGTLSFDEVGIIQPEYVSYHNQEVYSNENVYYGEVVVKRIEYDLWLGDTQVTYMNASNILGNSTAWYDASSNTLTLYDAHINVGERSGINNNIPDLKIVSIGNNTLVSNSCGIYSSKDFSIEGTGDLMVTGSDGFYLDSSHLTIGEGCTVIATGTATGNHAGFYCFGSGSYLTIDRCTQVYASSPSTSCSAIHGFNSVNFNRVGFQTPNNATYRNRDVYVNDVLYTNFVNIGPINYDLTVAGIIVNSKNCENITGSGISGSVSYDDVTNTLTLNNATISGGEFKGIESLIPNLTIMLEGTNTITSNLVGLAAQEKCIIGGTGTLNVTGEDGIVAYKDLTIQDGCTIRATGTGMGDYAGIYGWGNPNLFINRSSVTVNCNSTTVSAITGFEELNLDHVVFLTPANGTFQNHNVQSNNSLYTGQVLIEPAKYDLYVAGTRVTMLNAEDILGDGTAVYDADNNKLTLNNVNLNSYSDYSIYNQIAGLSIVLEGDNTLSSTSCGIMTQQNLTIEGTGSLFAIGSVGIQASNCNLIIRGGCSVNAYGTGTTAGIYGSLGRSLTIDGCYVKANTNSTTKASISGFSTMSLNRVDIINPSNGSYHDQNLYNQGAIYHDEVTIEPWKYDLWVNGIQVTTANQDHITGPGITGLVSYDNYYNQLTLDKATITNYLGNSGISNSIENLTIILNDTSTITSLSHGIYTTEELTIGGLGSLDVTGSNGIMSYESDLHIAAGGNVNATGTQYGGYGGIVGCQGYNLYVRAKVTAVNIHSTEGSIFGFSGLDITGCEITEPYDAVWSNSDRCVVDGNGNAVTNPVVIVPITYDVWVAGTQVTSLNAHDVLSDGTVSFDVDHCILTLNNTSIDAHGMYGIYSMLRGFKINVTGTNTITSTSDFCIYTLYDLTIEGTGSLDVTGGEGILALNGNITIQGGCVLNATGTYVNGSAIRGGEDYSLIVDLSYVTAQSNSTYWSAIYGFGSLEFVETEFQSPWGAYYQNRYVFYDGVAYYGQIEITPITYSLWVNGIQVTALNASHVTGPGISGSISYDADNDILTLNNATVEASDNIGLIHSIHDLTLFVEGTNTINSTHNGILFYYGMTIDGPGALNVTGSNGIVARNCNLTIQGGCHVNATATSTGNVAGIDGYSTSSSHSLTIDRSYVTASSASTQNSGICHFSTVYFNLVDFTIPNSAHFTDGQVYDQEENLYQELIVIEPVEYDLWVKGNRVSMLNADDVLGDGTVNYNASSNTLTLNGANFEVSGLEGIINGIPNLSIHLSGLNTITSDVSGIYSSKDFTIEGKGTLDITGEDGIYTYGCNLTIQDGCIINATGNNEIEGAGIRGNNTSVLTIIQSCVTATSLNENCCAIRGFGDLALTNVIIDTPVGGTYHNQAFWNQNDELYYGTIILMPAYDLVIKNIPVTYMNAGNILGDNTISYDAFNNILTLNGVNIDCGAANGIFSQIPDLTIVLQGDNTITSTTQGICSTKEFTIEGEGTLHVTGSDGIYVAGGNLTIQGGCTIYTTGTSDYDGAGIYGKSTRTLFINHSTVIANNYSDSQSAIYGFGSVSLTNSTWALPANGSYHDLNVYYMGHIYYGEVFIATEFDLRVANVTVSDFNAEDVLGDGKVSYNSATNTLTLNGASISAGNVQGILNQIENLTIESKGLNYITSNNTGIYSNKDISITGTGTIYITGNDGFYADNCDLTFRGGCNVVICGTGEYDNYSGIYGSQDHTLTIDSSFVLAYRTTLSPYRSAICGFSNLNLNKVGFTSPEDGTYQNRSVYSQGVIYDDAVEIIPFYDLWVAGVHVNAFNADDILYDGTVRYDVLENTLTLYETNIEVEYNSGIENNIPNLVIEVEGSNTISSNTTLIYSSKAFTIEGNGNLDLVTSGSSSYGIYAFGGDCTIQGGCNLTSTGIISGNYDLIINRSNVTANSSSTMMSSIYGFEHLILDHVEITTPSSGSYHNNFVYNGNQRYYGNVIISPKTYNLIVNGITVDAFNCDDVLEDGTVWYDDETKTLTLNDMAITAEDGAKGVESYIEGLTIRLIGDNYLGGGDFGFYLYGYNDTITGTGNIYIDGADCGIYGDVENTSIFIKDGCRITIDGISYGIKTRNAIIDNAKVTMQGQEVQTLYCSSIALFGTEITSPSDAHIDNYFIEGEGGVFTTYESFYDNDGIMTDWVTVEPFNIFNSRDNADWSDINNWSKNALPTTKNRVYVNTHCEVDDLANANEIIFVDDANVEILSGQTLRVNAINTAVPEQLVIDDGGQFYCGSQNVQATFHKTIVNATDQTDGWYGIASPMYYPTIQNLQSNTFDLYYYCEGCDQQEWQVENDYTYLFYPGGGFLYSNSGDGEGETTDLVMKGVLNPSGETNYAVAYSRATFEGIRGYNLIGNPYPHNLSMSNVLIGEDSITEFYRIAGDHIERCTSGEILPGEAFFIRVLNDETMIIIVDD